MWSLNLEISLGLGRNPVAFPFFPLCSPCSLKLLSNPALLVIDINFKLPINFLSINFFGLYIQIVLSRKGIF